MIMINCELGHATVWLSILWTTVVRDEPPLFNSHAPSNFPSALVKESPNSELARLRTEQSKTRQDEVFGGLSHAEQAEYEGRQKRIHDLEIECSKQVR
jgi:hypothetical protein